MIKRTKASISKFIIHKVGNKFNSTKNAFSEDVVQFDEDYDPRYDYPPLWTELMEDA